MELNPQYLAPQIQVFGGRCFDAHQLNEALRYFLTERDEEPRIKINFGELGLHLNQGLRIYTLKNRLKKDLPPMKPSDQIPKARILRVKGNSQEVVENGLNTFLTGQYDLVHITLSNTFGYKTGFKLWRTENSWGVNCYGALHEMTKVDLQFKFVDLLHFFHLDGLYKMLRR